MGGHSLKDIPPCLVPCIEFSKIAMWAIFKINPMGLGTGETTIGQELHDTLTPGLFQKLHNIDFVRSVAFPRPRLTLSHVLFDDHPLLKSSA